MPCEKLAEPFQSLSPLLKVDRTVVVLFSEMVSTFMLIAVPMTQLLETGCFFPRFPEYEPVNS